SGMQAVMDHLNFTYGVTDSRSFIKMRATAIGLTLGVGLLIIAGFSLIVLGGQIQDWMTETLGFAGAVAMVFAAIRWVLIIGALLMAFAITYYFGPDVEQKFRWISPGASFGTVMLVVASLAFRIYVENFGNY